VSQRAKERFLKACGLSDSHAFALEVEGPGEGEVVSRTFKRPFALVGRDPNVDLVLDHALVSRRHAYLQVIAGRVYCADLGSRSGVNWEEGPARSGWVDRTWGIRIGPYRIRAGAGMGTPNLEDPLSARAFGAPGSDWPALSLNFPQWAGGPTWQVSRVLTMVGRSSWCRLRLTHAEVSKIHFSVLRTQQGAWVIDCFGRGGTRVNGKLVCWAKLKDGDEIGVGPFLVRVCHRSSGITAQAESGECAGEMGSAPARRPPGVVPALSTPGRSLSGLPAASRTEVVDPYLAQLTTQVCQKQQQMFDQFQQSMSMMMQMFGSVHRDQMDLVRDELARLRQVKQDLSVLQADLAGRPAEVVLPPTDAAPGAGDPSTAMNDTLARIEAMFQAISPQPARPADGAGPEPRSEQTASPSTTIDGVLAAIGRGSTPSERRSSTVHSGGPTDKSIHTLLTQRIAELQEERQGRWQKVLGLMLGR
jgi:pSer/pThr/pTyr-binding forkhead associated (FHA) protein